MEAVGGLYRVRTDDGRDVQAVLRGKLKRGTRTGGRVVPGDRVRVSRFRGPGDQAIESVMPRENALVRAGPGGRRPKVVVANVGRAVVVMTALDPPFRREIADRFLALAESCRIPPLLVLNKADLPGSAAIIATEAAVYRSIGYTVLAMSAVTGEGIGELAGLLTGRVSSLVGVSGVGKTSLLNLLAPGHQLRTQPLSRVGRGRQTTVGVRLIPLGAGGWVADTPGFSDIALWGIDPRHLSGSFPEFEEPAESCRFSGCSHLHEPGCGVRAALETARIPRSRYDSYRALWEEIEGRAPSYD